MHCCAPVNSDAQTELCPSVGGGTPLSREHTVDASQIHHDWDASREPVVTIESGDVVHFDLPITGEGQVTETSTVADVVWDFDTIYNLAGPVHVAGAARGDTLEVEILELTPGPLGLDDGHPRARSARRRLPGAVPEDLRPARTDRRRRSPRASRCRSSPSSARWACRTDEPGPVSPFPPHRGGGNVDCRHLIAGSTLWLPIWCDGALFSCGDAHAAQGDGEVCVSADRVRDAGDAPVRRHERRDPGPAFHVPRRGRIAGPVPRARWGSTPI